jgi:sec-independent protein translocase protein TatB
VFNLDPAKLLIIAVVAVILLGPDKLPQVARQAGAAWRTFNDFRHRMENEVRSSIPDLPSSTDIARMARSPSALLNHLSNLSPDDPTASTATPGADQATSADQAGVESSPEGVSTNGSEHGSENGNAAGHPPMTSVPPTSTIPTPMAPPSVTSSPGSGSGAGPGPAQPADPSLN